MSRLSQQAEGILNRLAGNGIVAANAPFEPIPAGTINTVVRARAATGGTVYVRIGPPPGEIADAPSWMRGDALASEALVLERVRAAVPCVPVTVAAGFRSAEGHWLVQEAVPGQPLAAVLPRLASDDRAAIWRQLGAVVRRLHAVDCPWFGTPDGRHRFASWAEMVRADAEGLLGDARRFGLDQAPFERPLADIERHWAALDAIERPAVVHSDLDLRHVFVERREEAWTITGLIDWEYARYADPCSESLLVALLARPEEDPNRTAFLDGYGLGREARRDPAFQARQAIYRAIVAGWAATDAARLGLENLKYVNPCRHR